MSFEPIKRKQLIYPKFELLTIPNPVEIERLLTEDNIIAERLSVEAEIRASILLTLRRHYR